MKKILLLSVSLLCSFATMLNAQDYITINAQFYSEALDTIKKVTIYLPGDYYQNPVQQYATITYLHGGYGNEGSGLPEAATYFDLHASNTTIVSPPAIFVCPDGSCEPYAGSVWMNSELYGNYGDFVMQDVIHFVEENFRVIPEKDFRVITGLSMGGYGSARLAVNYPDSFRACFPYIGFLAIQDTLINKWKQLCFNENGSYHFNPNAGTNTEMFFTMCGGLSPNMDIEPYHVEIPIDTLGNIVDSVMVKWRQHDSSSKVKDLPGEDELAWFLGCGTNDYMMTYPTYIQFMDSLDFYGIGYSSNYFPGDHVYHEQTWILGLNWIDSILNESFDGSPYLLSKEPVAGVSGSISVFPNPAYHNVEVSCFLPNQGKLKIDLIDIRGKTLLSKEEKHQFGMVNCQLNLTEYLSGIYFIKIQTNQETIIRKLIKL
ncbi:MAG: alpha/beta hydrolase-fold protein [Bacteroidota bacterium]|nr:alpha/beta hydrolase-fold protein [Bacteroidota bacterium]